MTNQTCLSSFICLSASCFKRAEAKLRLLGFSCCPDDAFRKKFAAAGFPAKAALAAKAFWPNPEVLDAIRLAKKLAAPAARDDALAPAETGGRGGALGTWGGTEATPPLSEFDMSGAGGNGKPLADDDPPDVTVLDPPDGFKVAAALSMC